jgi:hypothetical protein
MTAPGACEVCGTALEPDICEDLGWVVSAICPKEQPCETCSEATHVTCVSCGEPCCETHRDVTGDCPKCGRDAA